MAYHRLFLRSPDGDSLTVFVPLTLELTYDEAAPKPHLVRAVWGGDDWFAEFRVDGGEPEFASWCSPAAAEDAWETTGTDLLSVPVRVGQSVDVGGYDFEVMTIQQL